MITVTIDRIAAGGDGVGRHPDGRVVFVPRTTPGDVAEVEEVQSKPRFLRARLVKVKAPGADRISPRCPHYVADGCGGCQLQHLAPAAQLAVKRTVVGDALRRIGKIAIEDPPIRAPADGWRYRGKITLAVRETQRGRVIGLHRYAEPGVIFDLEDCLITNERVMELWRAVRPHADLLPSGVEGLVLREDRDGGLHVVARGGGGTPWDVTLLARRLDPSISIWWQPSDGAARVMSGPQAGFPALAFEQSNAALAGVIRESAVGALGEIRDAVVWDLYGGVGDTAELLARRGARVWSVDFDRTAQEWAARRGSSGIKFILGRVEEVLARLPEPDAVIANPPRTGLAAAAVARLRRWGDACPGARLAYISCDPATLARDLGALPSFSHWRLTAYDLFPQTSHVETLAIGQAA
ncbi:MAG: TRAM domain-containing protein [Gemmatimonadetes bacterium]|nr:TRAM domain-containing protein [Gemmatimonadota bacterium]